MRYDCLDFAKGIGILLVIMGHSLFPLHQAIDIFHMPLFFFLSGLTLKKYDVFGQFLIKKIDRIIIPLLFFTCCSNVIEKLISYQGPIFNGPLWFLYALFGGVIIAEIVIKSYDSKVTLYLVTFLISVLIYLISLSNYSDVIPFHLETSVRASVFILLGYCLKTKIYSLIDSKILILVLISSCSFLIYALGLFISIHNYNLEGAKFINNRICTYNYALFYLSSISGTLFIVSASIIINRISFVNWLGKNSLIIMCVHFPFVEWLNSQLATTVLYSSYGTPGKIILGLIAYSLTIIFCLPFIYFCKKYIPRFTGHKPLIAT